MGATVKNQSEAVASTEPERVFLWRHDQFVRCGATGALAEVLASSRVDVRVFERLTNAGCSVTMAARILL